MSHVPDAAAAVLSLAVIGWGVFLTSEASHLRRDMAVLDVIADGEASCRTA